MARATVWGWLVCTVDLINGTDGIDELHHAVNIGLRDCTALGIQAVRRDFTDPDACHCGVDLPIPASRESAVALPIHNGTIGMAVALVDVPASAKIS